MKIKYRTIATRTATLEIVQLANQIIEDFQAQGYSLTLRQLYYQFIARDWFPDSWIDEKYNERHSLSPDTKNTQKNYDRLGTIITSGRRAGMIDWEAIVDRTRFLRQTPHWEDSNAFMSSVVPQFATDLWKGQKHYVELWFEKDALLGVFERAAESQRLPLCSNRGYMSDSTVWEAAQRINHIYLLRGCTPIILHFGDHDPSGLDMSRDLEERFEMFDCPVEVRRIALNMDQVDKYKCPPNPAKETDSRFRWYKKKYGSESWELDALTPDVMVGLVVNAVNPLIDEKKWKKALSLENKHKKRLQLVANNFDKAVDAVK